MKKTICIILAALMLGGVIGYAASKHPFTDVPDGAYFTDAVQWAWDNGITNGVDSEHFEPNRAITRAEFVTMLWRWSGNEPEIEPTPEPTRDITKPPKVSPKISAEALSSGASFPASTVRPATSRQFWGQT